MAELEGVVAGAYGLTHTITLQNKQGAAIDISAYTGDKIVYLRSPSNNKMISSTADFNSDGTDGKLDFTFTSDSNPDHDGEWESQAELNATGILAKTWPFITAVLKSVGS